MSDVAGFLWIHYVRVARQAGTEPGFVHNGVWYPLSDYEFKYVLIPVQAFID
jgi:hypothetical protein